MTAFWRWIDDTLFSLGRELRLSYLPPLMVYLAAGISGLTAIVGTFFVKEQFGFSAAFLAGLAFWAGIPWALKMPVGHLVDLIWRWKSALVYLGAALIAASVLIMYGLIVRPDHMARTMSLEAWFVLSTLLAPVGYVLQDVVADAMTVEAVPVVDENGKPYSDDAIKIMHTTMQTLGRIAIISGLVLVAALNIWAFAGVETMSAAEKLQAYADIHLAALVIPVISILGVMLATIMQRRRVTSLLAQGFDRARILTMLAVGGGNTKPDWRIIIGSAAFVAFTLTTGLSALPFSQEIVFAGSMAIVWFLMFRLFQELEPALRRAVIGTTIIVFIFRATPLPGPGATWWQIDVLGFDQRFLSILTLLSSALTLVGMIALRPFMARHSIATVVLVLTFAAGILSLPTIGLFYGLHEWTSARTGGIVDAHFIAVVNTALESPLGQVAMVPMLAWIARNAPAHLKATFFAVMASFTNLALSASAIGTKYMNEIFTIEREVRDRAAGTVTVPADYGELGWLLIVVTVLTVVLPVAAVVLVQMSRFRTTQ